MVWPYAFAQPTVKYRYLNYELDDIGNLPNDNPSAGSAVANLDAGLFFERPTSLFSGRTMTQTLEPRLYYLYSEYEDQSDLPDFDSAELTFTYSQLFRDTRFSGRDRLDDANQLAIGLTTRFIDDETGKSLLDASIGQIYYFRDREVRLGANSDPLDDTGSELAGELTFTPNDNLDLRTSLIYDPFSKKMNSGFFLSSYKHDNGGLFNLSYSFRRPLTTTALRQTQTEQVSASAYWPINNRWSFFAAVNYSLEASKSVEDMAGVEYDTCCWTVRLLHLRYLNNVSGQLTDFTDPDLVRENTTQFQIVLKGMGGYGDRITQIMEDLIRGFEERDD
jgi:LPS-assembly protein